MIRRTTLTLAAVTALTACSSGAVQPIANLPSTAPVEPVQSLATASPAPAVVVSNGLPNGQSAYVLLHKKPEPQNERRRVRPVRVVVSPRASVQVKGAPLQAPAKPKPAVVVPAGEYLLGDKSFECTNGAVIAIAVLAPAGTKSAFVTVGSRREFLRSGSNGLWNAKFRYYDAHNPPLAHPTIDVTFQLPGGHDRLAHFPVLLKHD